MRLSTEFLTVLYMSWPGTFTRHPRTSTSALCAHAGALRYHTSPTQAAAVGRPREGAIGASGRRDARNVRVTGVVLRLEKNLTSLWAEVV